MSRGTDFDLALDARRHGTIDCTERRSPAGGKERANLSHDVGLAWTDVGPVIEDGITEKNDVAHTHRPWILRRLFNLGDARKFLWPAASTSPAALRDARSVPRRSKCDAARRGGRGPLTHRTRLTRRTGPPPVTPGRGADDTLLTGTVTPLLGDRPGTKSSARL